MSQWDAVATVTNCLRHNSLAGEALRSGPQAADGEIVRAVLAGDRESYARLVERYRDRNARYAAIGMMALQYALVVYLVASGYFTPALLIVLLPLKTFTLVFAVYRQAKPEQRPDAYPADTWPLWFVAFAFLHNRRFGLLFLLGLIGDLALRRLFL